MLRTTSACLLILALASCGDRPVTVSQAAPATAATASVPVGAPAPVQTPPESAAAPEAVAEAVADSYSRNADGWRVSFVLNLPALPAAKARTLRRACEAWLFQGLVSPRGDFAASAAEAHRLLVQDTPRGAEGEPWYSERAVHARLVGAGWLSLERDWKEFAGGAHANQRSEGLLVEIAAGRALTIDEVVPADRVDALRALLARELRRVRGLPPDGPLTSAIASDAELPIPMPVLTTDGAVFTWNAYEIGPFSDGAYRATLPAAAVRGLLARDPWRQP
jgi:hypothetical protein